MTLPPRPDWTAPSLHDRRLAAYQAARAVVPPETESAGRAPGMGLPLAEKPPDPTARSRCPGIPGHRCGRSIRATEMRDVSGCPEAVVGRRAQTDGLCDACESLLLTTGRVALTEWFMWRGAPPVFVGWLRQKAAAQQADRQRQGLAFQIRIDPDISEHGTP